MKLLDQGYIELVEWWGSDERIIESARMSTGKGFLGWIKCSVCGLHLNNEQPHTSAPGIFCTNETEFEPGDEKLLRRLYTHKHTTPFEMCGATFEVQAPIFTIREWQRHRTLSYNEFSARFAELPDITYMPSEERLMNAKQSTTNKQGSEAGFDIRTVMEIQASLLECYAAARDLYEQFLKAGVAREIARLVIPVAQYSRMRVSGNLFNWIRFLHLRMPKDAQWEIRQYANAVHENLARKFPRTMNLFEEEYDAKSV